MHERSQWDRSTFATLTYDEAYVPFDGSLWPDEFTKFVKRLRRRLGARRLRYYACGEYGELYGRPHFHAILFGVGVQEKALVQEAWPFGLIHLGTVTKASVRYTADYVGKAVSPRDGRRKRGQEAYDILTGRRYGDRQVPYAVMSQGLGRAYVDAHGFSFLRHGVTSEGSRVPTPRYYRERLSRERVVVSAMRWFQRQADLWQEVQFDEATLSVEFLEPVFSAEERWSRVARESEEGRRQFDLNLRARSALRAKGFM
jgi:hypothetical protein